MTNMTGKVAVITGASSGIGRATAQAFAARGASIAVAARRAKELATLVEDITTRGGRAIFQQTDVSVASDVERLVARTIDTYGRLDFAVNNAGFEGEAASIIDYAEEVWDQVLGINLKGTFLCMKYEARAMVQAGNGGSFSFFARSSLG